MADQPAVEIVGLKELLRDLKAAGDTGADDLLKTAHRDAAEVVAGAARPLVPRVSGALLGTVRAMASLRGGRVAAGKAKVPYAKPIHFGWPARHIAAQPFLTDALAAVDTRAVDAFEAAAEKLIERIGP